MRIRNIERRLKRLESRLSSAAVPMVIQIKYVSPGGRVVDGPRISVAAEAKNAIGAPVRGRRSRA